MIEIFLSKSGPLHSGKFRAIVDECDSDLASIDWTVRIYRVSRTPYAFRREYKLKKTVYLHQLIAERHLGPCPHGLSVDHLNRNGLDNRRSNLRYATQSDQVSNIGLRRDNTSGHTGVYWVKARNRWHAKAWINKKETSLGYFKTLPEAIAARAKGGVNELA